MSDTCCQTPLLDLLQRVPADARATYEHDATSHSNIPYGRYCQEAATEITRLRAELDIVRTAYGKLNIEANDLAGELATANERLAALAKAYDSAPGLPLEAPGADLVGWTDVLIGFGHVLNDEIKAIYAVKGK